MTQHRIPYPPSQDALIAELKTRHAPLDREAAGAIDILYRTVCKVLDVVDESGTIIEDLCILLARFKPFLDENHVLATMLLEKYPDETLLKDFQEHNMQMLDVASKEATRLTKLALANVQKSKAKG